MVDSRSGSRRQVNPRQSFFLKLSSDTVRTGSSQCVRDGGLHVRNALLRFSMLVRKQRGKDENIRGVRDSLGDLESN